MGLTSVNNIVWNNTINYNGASSTDDIDANPIFNTDYSLHGYSKGIDNGTDGADIGSIDGSTPSGSVELYVSKTGSDTFPYGTPADASTTVIPVLDLIGDRYVRASGNVYIVDGETYSEDYRGKGPEYNFTIHGASGTINSAQFQDYINDASGNLLINSLNFTDNLRISYQTGDVKLYDSDLDSAHVTILNSGDSEIENVLSYNSEDFGISVCGSGVTSLIKNTTTNLAFNEGIATCGINANIRNNIVTASKNGIINADPDVLPSSLKHYYSFPTGSGSTVYDQVGDADGTLGGTYSWTTQPNGSGAIDLTDIDNYGYISFPAESWDDVTLNVSELTISMYIKFQEDVRYEGSIATLFSISYPYNLGRFYLQVRGKLMLFTPSQGSSAPEFRCWEWQNYLNMDHDWHHIALVWNGKEPSTFDNDSAKVSIYIDGNKTYIGNVAVAAPPDILSGNASTGATISDVNYNIRMTLADFMIFSDNLSDAQIYGLYRRMLGVPKVLVTEDYNCSFGNVTDYRNISIGSNSISEYPVFAGIGDNNFKLLSASPCIDAGDPSDDFSNENTHPNGAIDMGRYGNTPNDPGVVNMYIDPSGTEVYPYSSIETGATEPSTAIESIISNNLTDVVNLHIASGVYSTDYDGETPLGNLRLLKYGSDSVILPSLIFNNPQHTYSGVSITDMEFGSGKKISSLNVPKIEADSVLLHSVTGNGVDLSSTTHVPYGFWKMDEGTGTTASDSSNYSNDLTLVNSPTWDTGVEGSGINFDSSSSQYLNAPLSSSIEDVLSTEDFTICMWAKCPFGGTSVTYSFMSFGHPDASYIDLWVSNVTITFRIRPDTDSSSDYTKGYSMPSYRWTHICVTYGKSPHNIKFYINGINIYESASTSNAPELTLWDASSVMRIGARANDSMYARGVFDEAIFFKGVLNEAEIINIMNRRYGSLADGISINSNSTIDHATINGCSNACVHAENADVTVKNSLLTNSTYNIEREGNCSVTSDYNFSYNASPSGFTDGANDKVVNPMYNDADSNDYTLSSKSGARNQASDDLNIGYDQTGELDTSNIHVHPSGNDTVGTTWYNAFTTIQDAAAASGAAIRISNDTYNEDIELSDVSQTIEGGYNTTQISQTELHTNPEFDYSTTENRNHTVINGLSGSGVIGVHGPEDTDITIKNITVDASGSTFAGIFTDGTGAKNIILNNVIIHSTGASSDHAIASSGNITMKFVDIYNITNLSNGAANITATNTNFHNSSIGEVPTGTTSIDYSNSWNGWSITGLGSNNLSSDPMYRNAGTDFRLMPGSPSVDAGDPADDASDQPNNNSDRVNIGAFGGTNLATGSGWFAYDINSYGSPTYDADNIASGLALIPSTMDANYAINMMQGVYEIDPNNPETFTKNTNGHTLILRAPSGYLSSIVSTQDGPGI